VGGTQGMLLFGGLGLVMNFVTYWFSDRLALLAHRAQQVSPAEAPTLFAIVGRLARRAGMPMPRIYIIPSAAANAFATGRNPEHAAVAVTTGLLQTLSREEIAGVLAHELAHVKNRDTLTMTITATIAGAISMLAQFGLFFGGHRNSNSGAGMIGTIVMVVLAPLAAMLVQMAISRTREYAADNLGARISGRPDALASALAKISQAAEQVENPSAERAPATAHLFIVNPLTGRGMDNLFATHPSTANRIAALRQVAAQMGIGRFDQPRNTPSYPAPGTGPWGNAPRRGADDGNSGTRGPWG